MSPCSALTGGRCIFSGVQIDFKPGFAYSGVIVATLMVALGVYGLFRDIESLWLVGAPHISIGSGGRSAWLRDLDQISNGWFTVLLFGGFAIYAARLGWSMAHYYLAPRGVVRFEERMLHFNRGLFVSGPVDLSDVEDVTLSFDPDNPSNSPKHWFWDYPLESDS
jgi:hypothetical protein